MLCPTGLRNGEDGVADSRTWNSSGEVSRISSTEPETNWNSSGNFQPDAPGRLRRPLRISMAAVAFKHRLNTRPEQAGVTTEHVSGLYRSGHRPVPCSPNPEYVRPARTDAGPPRPGRGAPLSSRMSTTSSYSTCSCGMVSASVAATWCSDSTVCSLWPGWRRCSAAAVPVLLHLSHLRLAPAPGQPAGRPRYRRSDNPSALKSLRASQQPEGFGAYRRPLRWRSSRYAGTARATRPRG